MGLFNLFSKKPDGKLPGSRQQPQPYKDEGLNKIYELLFCDNIDLYRVNGPSTGYPWEVLLSGAPDVEQLKIVAADKTLESRIRILAYRLILESGSVVKEKDLLGVVVEVALPSGLDVLASFSDGTARYLNHSGKILIWETQTEQSNQLIGELFSDSRMVVANIGPWEKERKPFPVGGFVRMTFLVSDGLYFGEGPFEVLQKDSMGGPVISSATKLMSYLTSQQTVKKG